MTVTIIDMRERGLSRITAQKAEHFAQESGERRTPEDLKMIADAAYGFIAHPSYGAHRTYEEAEAIYYRWAIAPVRADRAVHYIRLGIDITEALITWEGEFDADPEGTAAALDTLYGLYPRA